MPLYTSSHYSSTASAESPWRTFVRTLATLFLRAGAGVILAIQHVIPELVPAWRFVWDNQPWGFVDMIAGAGMPLPAVIAPAYILITSLAILALVIGLVTRLSAIVLTILAVLAFPTAYAVNFAETSLLYMLIFGAIVLLGPGILSLDAILTYRKPPTAKRSLA